MSSTSACGQFSMKKIETSGEAEVKTDYPLYCKYQLITNLMLNLKNNEKINDTVIGEFSKHDRRIK